MRTIGEALDQGDRVFWWAPRPGDVATYGGENNILWWQDGRDGEPQWADYHALPDLLEALKPFAEKCPDDPRLAGKTDHPVVITVRLKHLRQARDAIAKIKGG